VRRVANCYILHLPLPYLTVYVVVENVSLNAYVTDSLFIACFSFYAFVYVMFLCLFAFLFSATLLLVYEDF